MRRAFGLAIALLIVAAFPARAQAPHAVWQTIETPHFRVHYPADYEMWTRHVAGRLEAVREAVIAVIGYAPAQKVDVVVMNPLSTPNGEALTLLDSPRLVLWADNPDPESEIGNFGDWIDVLTTHEVAHLVHLLRPSRNRLRHFLEQYALALGPITLSAPRWVLEGYATVIEGRVTGTGRPHGAFRGALLRRWAVAGRLPSYSQLSSDSGDYLGMSMAYLAGSAYLEWLERRAGPESLQSLWRRLTARRTRSFEAAFEAVFADSPVRLYDRFTAELTAESMREEAALAGRRQDGELWQETRWQTGEPVVSPEGDRLAYVVRERKKRPRLVIVSITPDSKEQQRLEDQRRKLIEKDPEDVPAVSGRSLPHKVLSTLILADGGDIDFPRWLADGKSILFTHRVPDHDGFLHSDLFRWYGRGEADRLTTLADVRDADPLPDGLGAIAVRSRYGMSQLVRIDLAGGGISELTPLEVAPVSEPRVSPAGDRVAYVQHRGGAWQLVVRPIDGGSEILTSVPENNSVAQPAWSRSGDAIFATVLGDSTIDLARFRLQPAGLVAEKVTRTLGGAFAPAPAPDGALFFLSLEPDGLAIRRLADPSNIAETPTTASGPPLRVFAEESDLQSRAYGIGRQELSILTGSSILPGAYAIEVGLRAGDLIGRLDSFATATIANGTAPRGWTIGSTWRGWPIAVSTQAFSDREEPSNQTTAVDRVFDLNRRGVEFRGDWSRRFPISRLEVSGGAVIGKVRSAGDDWVDRRVDFARVRYELSRVRRDLRFSPSIDVTAERGSTGGRSWSHQRTQADFSVRFGGSVAAAGYDRDWSGSTRHPADQVVLGGAPSTVLPESAAGSHVYEPALPLGVLVGDWHEAERLSLTTPIVPGQIFFTRHRVRQADGSWETISLAGLRYDVDADEGLPLLKVPPFTATLGIARILDAPLNGKTNVWFSLRWRP
jgi:Tol biopolymer transport system component